MDITQNSPTNSAARPLQYLTELYMCEQLSLLGRPPPVDLKCYLNTELPQYTHGKTEKMLNYLAEYYYKNFITQKNNGQEHPITIVGCNNSLLETMAWKDRSRKMFTKEVGDTTINIHILSSKKDADYSQMNALLADIMVSAGKNARKLPHIIIMCMNSTRIKGNARRGSMGVIHLLDVLKNWQHKPGLKFTFNFVFDEADKSRNLKLICELIKFIKREHIYCVKEITLVTATPQGMFKKLKKVGITTLLNIDSKLDIGDRDIINANYMNIKEHNIELVEGPADPIEYFKHIIHKKPQLFENEGNIIFAPAKWRTAKHEAMAIQKFTTENGYWVLMINGYFKGFISPIGERNNLSKFKIEHNINGELRDYLRKWREIHPRENLLITGLNCCERGITFNTDGFNFTHMIITHYHAKNINRLLQLIGRGSGNKQFAKSLTVICPQTIYKISVSYVDDMMKLKDANIKEYKKEDFDHIESYNSIMNKPSNFEEYDLNYRIFDELAEAKKYATQLKLKLQRRNCVTNKSGKKFYVDSLGLSNRKVQSLKEGVARLSTNLSRSTSGRASKVRLTHFRCYSDPCIEIANKQYAGGDPTTLKIIIIVPDHNDDKNITKKFIKKLDDAFEIPSDERYTTKSKREKQL